MRIALLDVKNNNKVGQIHTAVNMRNFALLAKELNAEFIYSINQFNNNREYDVFIFGFGSPFTEINLTKEFCLKSKNASYYFLSGEYEQQTSQPLYYLNVKYNVIKNYETLGKLAGKKDRINKVFDININLLVAKQPNQLIAKKYDCIYYGRWRDDRADYFKKYIQGGLYLSTSTKNMKKFKHAGCNPKYLDTISWSDRKETLNLFRYSLYIEDKYTHNVFNNLANRWYEAGFCNVVVFFDINCWNTIRKSELAYFEEQIKDYIVTDYKSLQEKIDYCNQDFEKHLAIQKGWRMQELQLRSDMINELKSIISQ